MVSESRTAWDANSSRNEFGMITMAVTDLSSTQGEPATAVLIIIELKDNVRDVMLRAVRNVTQQQPRMNPVTMNPVPLPRE